MGASRLVAALLEMKVLISRAVAQIAMPSVEALMASHSISPTIHLSKPVDGDALAEGDAAGHQPEDVPLEGAELLGSEHAGGEQDGDREHADDVGVDAVELAGDPHQDGEDGGDVVDRGLGGLHPLDVHVDLDARFLEAGIHEQDQDPGDGHEDGGDRDGEDHPLEERALADGFAGGRGRSCRGAPRTMALGGVPMGVPMPPMLAAKGTPRARPTRNLSPASRRWMIGRTTAMMVAVVAVLLIHIERMPVMSMRPSRTQRGLAAEGFAA